SVVCVFPSAASLQLEVTGRCTRVPLACFGFHACESIHRRALVMEAPSARKRAGNPHRGDRASSFEHLKQKGRLLRRPSKPSERGMGWGAGGGAGVGAID